MNKSNKILSILISVLIVLSGVNLLVGIGNTYRIRQLENAPAVVIEEYLSETVVAPFTETTTETTTLQTITETETTIETSVTQSLTDKKDEFNIIETESKTSENEKATAETTVKETQATNSDICFVTNSGTKYHKEGCSYLKKSKTKMTVQDAKSNGYTPCSRCY